MNPESATKTLKQRNVAKTSGNEPSELLLKLEIDAYWQVHPMDRDKLSDN